MSLERFFPQTEANEGTEEELLTSKKKKAEFNRQNQGFYSKIWIYCYILTDPKQNLVNKDSFNQLQTFYTG